MYKQVNTFDLSGQPNGIAPFIQRSDGACIPFDPANTDYSTFKAQILADEAQLEDADGAVMPAEQAKAFVKELP